MLKHMLTQTPSLPADLAPTAAKNTTNSGAGSNGVPRPQGPPPAPPSAGPAGISASLGPGPNFKLASRANQQNSNNSGQMLDSQATATTDTIASHLDDMMPLPPTSPQIMSRPSRDSITPYGNLTLNQSIYANTVTLPKINGNGNATHMRHNGSPVTHMRQNASPVTHRRHGASPVRHGSNGSNGSSNKSNGLNTSKLSSSNSPATTNQTKSSIMMDSSRDHSHHELENTQLSPINGRASRPNLLSNSPTPPGGDRPPLLQSNGYAVNSNGANNSVNTSRYSHRNNSMNTSNHMNSTTVNGGQHNVHNQSAVSKNKLNASALLPANVSKFMLLSKEAGVRVTIQSLGLLCLVSLLLALVSFVFLLKISPTGTGNTNEMRKKYQFDFLSPSDFESLYEVTLALSALTLVLNLCCLVVCAIQFLFAVKLVKSTHGRHRTNKYLKGAASTRVCAIAGFFVSIPLFLTGVVLYTFLHFDSTPAIVSAVLIGLGILFCGGAVVHNVFVWQKEKTANVTKSASNSPVLARNQNGGIHQLDATSKSATINGGLPQATLDLSGPNSRVLELSTLV